jgi:glycosyltransferase involved in cell wall biosynthesis
MNVLHCINNLNREGAQIVVRNLVTIESKDQPNYYVCVRQPGGSLAVELREQGIAVLEPPRYYGFRSIRQSFFFLKRQCVENRIQIIHAHMADAAFLGWLVARKLKLPLIISHHGQDVLLKCNPVCRLVYYVLLQLAARYAALNIAVSPAVAERLRKLLRINQQVIEVVSNGVRIPEDSQLIPRECAIDKPRPSPVLVSVGRLVPLKGQRQLVYAVAGLRKHFPDIHLYIVGSGEMESELKRLADDEKLGDCIEFTGAVDDVTTYLASADIYVSSSESEGMSVSVLEAMAWRLPVVASDIPGNRSVIEQGETGFLYELNKIEDLVNTIMELVRNPALANAVASRARSMVVQQYSALRAEQKHVEIYRRTLERVQMGFADGK